MSKCTKGKLKISNNGFETKNIITDGRYMIACTGDSGDWHWHFNNTAEADAAELVRRWNAFEDGGLVEELRKACEESQKVFGFIAENYKSAPHFPAAERMVEAALAKS